MNPINEDARVAAVAKRGKLTRRQAGFLVLVMVHSGVCVRRQYCAYAHIRPPDTPRRTAEAGSFTFTVAGSTPPSTRPTTAIASRSPWRGPSSG